MTDASFEPCPDPADLGAFADGTLRDSDQLAFERTRRHVEQCPRCSRGADALARWVPRARASPRGISADLAHAVAEQQRALRDALESVEAHPVPGELWLSSLRHTVCSEDRHAMPWLLLVVDRYWREYAREWSLDVVPVTEGSRAAADWTYVVPESHCGWGKTVAVHIDFKVPAAREVLTRRVARLSEGCRHEVLSVVNAYATGAEKPELRCGSLGFEWGRISDEWLALEPDLYALVEALRDVADPGELATSTADLPEGWSIVGRDGTGPTAGPGHAERSADSRIAGHAQVDLGACGEAPEVRIPGESCRFAVHTLTRERPRTIGDLVEWAASWAEGKPHCAYFQEEGGRTSPRYGFLWSVLIPDGPPKRGGQLQKHLRVTCGVTLDAVALTHVNRILDLCALIGDQQEPVTRRAARSYERREGV